MIEPRSDGLYNQPKNLSGALNNPEKYLKMGMVVVIDNASFHKSMRIKNLIESVGATLIYLPPYSPDLNPIEHYWHKIKTTIRKMMRDTKMVLDEAMANTLKDMSMF